MVDETAPVDANLTTDATVNEADVANTTEADNATLNVSNGL